MKLKDFLLHKTRAEELCIICDPWIIGAVWIDHEDLFSRSLDDRILLKEVAKDEWKPFESCDENGKNQLYRAHYIYIN